MTDNMISTEGGQMKSSDFEVQVLTPRSSGKRWEQIGTHDTRLGARQLMQDICGSLIDSGISPEDVGRWSFRSLRAVETRFYVEYGTSFTIDGI
jgi:hypothetical protein